MRTRAAMKQATGRQQIGVAEYEMPGADGYRSHGSSVRLRPTIRVPRSPLTPEICCRIEEMVRREEKNGTGTSTRAQKGESLRRERGSEIYARYASSYDAL